MKDIRTTFGETKFDVRACGILCDDNKILVSYESDGSITLNGGAVKISESSEQAVVREFFEETNLHVRVESLAAVIENFFSLNGQPYQQIIFVYRLKLKEDKKQQLKCKEKLNVKREPLADINNLKPKVLNDIVQSNEPFIHCVNRD